MKIKKDLLKRSITGFFLALVAIAWMFVGAVYLTPVFGIKPQWSAYSFMLLNTLILMVAVYEIIKLRRTLKWNIWIKGLVFFMAFILLWMPLGNENFGPYLYNKNWFQVWISLLVYLLFIGTFVILRLTTKTINNEDLLFIFFWIFYLVFTFKGINFLMLQSKGIRLLGWPTIAYVWVIVISSDVGAYIGGSLWGKKQLAPKISPKKTWAGAYTGFASSVVLSMILVTLLLELGHYNPLPIYEGTFGKWPIYIIYLGFSCIFSFVSQCGDLLFSYVKRNHNVKDFSNIFPGHGGLLDRLDGFSLVVLFMYLVTLFLFF